MDENHVLIYHYSTKKNQWYDATKNITYYKNTGNSWLVRFSNSDKFVHVSYRNMHIYESPRVIPFVEIYYKDSICFKVKKLVCFDCAIYKIFYENGYTNVALPDEIKIVKDVLKDDKTAYAVMSYYHDVVEEIVHTEEDEFLLQQFDDISYVNEDSVLSLYLKGKLEKSGTILKHPIISPFGINLSQSNALKMIFSNRISIIEGPPGTGKTQTILNFIANAVINNYSVAVVSNNNSATDNVYEKLEKHGYSFISAPLGNRDNVESFFEEYDSAIPLLKRKDVDQNELRNLFDDLPSFFEIENEKNKKIEQLESLELEYSHFKKDNSSFVFNFIKINPKKIKTNSILSTIARLKESDKKFSFFEKLMLKFKLKLDKKFFNLPPDECMLHLYDLFYQSKINEIKTEINDLKNKMNNQSFDEKMDTYIKLSKTFFESELSKLFINNTRGRYEKDNYKRQFDEFVRDYPVILSSTYSLAKCTKRGFLFDYLIVDESSQVNMASAILSMRVARNIVVVGDIKQLPQIDDSSFEQRNEQLLKRHGVAKEYSYYGNSIMSSLLSLYGKNLPRIMLKEHYRCNPDIIRFCNKRFYNDELIIYTSNSSQDYSMKVIKTVPGNFARKNPNGPGLYNQREIDEIKSLFEREKLDDVGIIAPYRYQTEMIQAQIGVGVEASTIHKFQGREKKTIIFSSVINDSNEFVENDNLINVAVSRAIDKFILVTSDKVAKSSHGVLSDLIDYIKYHNDFGQSEDGNVRSIYDLLYKDYEDILNRFRHRHRSKDYDSENLTKALLTKILKESQFNSYWFLMHVSLRDFIQIKQSELTTEEYAFFKNPNAHADFLIYNKVSLKPVLVIEVDGVSFHEQNKEQLERDAKKNSILNKAGIKLLRLKTNESSEETKIRAALTNI